LAILFALLNHSNTLYRTLPSTNSATFAIIIILLEIAVFIAAISHVRTKNIALAAFNARVPMGYRVHGSPVPRFEFSGTTRLQYGGSQR
jgi:hypothetical protein